MKRRLTAVRMFSKEFNQSTHALEETVNSFKIQKLLSPLGIPFGRILVIGVLTDVAEVKDSPKVMRARISDPHGGFTVFASTYQPQALTMLTELEPPCYVAVVARPKLLEEGKTPILRPEYIIPVEESTYDRWIKETTEHTKKRIYDFENNESEEIKIAKEKYGTDISEYKELVGIHEDASEDEDIDIEFEEEEIDFSKLLDS